MNSISGRLCHHLDPKYAHAAGDGPHKKLFTPILGDERDFVNFPFVEAVLSSLWQERRRDLLALTTAFVSFGIAVTSLIVSVAV